jgi:hypothetical protein
VIGPVIGHVPCALDQQRKVRQASLERRTAWMLRRRRRGQVVSEPPAPDTAGEDVWRALRF